MKKLTSIILSIFLILANTLPATALSTIPLKSIKLTNTNITLKAGQSSNLTVTFTPTNTTQKKLTYVSSNKKIATVDATGKITGISAGTVTITINTLNKNISAKCSVTVSKPDDAWKWPTQKWSISTPEKQGIDPNALSHADKRIKDNYPNIYSLLVVRHGYLVYEKYYQGMDKDYYFPVYSITKSVMSALTGIALREKYIKNIDQKISDFFPEYFANIDDARKKEITLRHILTMSGGLETIDSNSYEYYSSSDWLGYTIKKPMIDDPGSKFLYNSGLPHFLSAIITKESKMNALEFANKYLFSQTGITPKMWEFGRDGYYNGGSGLYLTTADMAKFGYLYLKNGVWDGKQIIPQEWVKESMKRHITTGPGVDYGYLFWVEDMNGKFTYRAEGAGGQKIVIVPDLDMVIVVTGDTQSISMDKTRVNDFIADYVVPAAIN